MRNMISTRINRRSCFSMQRYEAISLENIRACRFAAHLRVLDAFAS
jgi:hypothetical protein